jgi:hypothetical protein
MSGKNMSCLYDICLLHSLGRAFICGAKEWAFVGAVWKHCI